jgi:plastocyanin
MKARPNDLLMITFLTAELILLLPVGIKQTMGQDDDNNDIATTNANSLTGNNTIILNPSEVNGTYRWVNNSGGINPTLDITMGNEYRIKINNPTDEEHELIIENTENSKVASSEEIAPGKNTEFKFKTEETGELNYYCEYHPETMKGIIKIIEPM